MPSCCFLYGIKCRVYSTVSGSDPFNLLIMAHELHMRHGTDLVSGIDHVSYVMISRRNLHGFGCNNRIQFLQCNTVFLLCRLYE